MNEPVEEIRYKGCNIGIYQDDYNESPDEWGNEDLFLVAFHRDFEVERKGFEKEICQTMVDDDTYSEADGETIERVKEIKKKYHIFGLEAYIHSGVVLALSYEGNFPDRRWDVSQLGLVFVEKESWKKEKEAKKAAENLIETWNQYLSGEIYNFLAESADGEHIDSCGGFYGDYHGDLLKEAKSSIDYYLAQKKKQAKGIQYKEARDWNGRFIESNVLFRKLISNNPDKYQDVTLKNAISDYEDYLKQNKIGKGKSFEDWLLTEI